MKDAGKYLIPFTWMQYTTSSRDSLNQAVESYTSNGTLWGSLEDLGGNRGNGLGGPQTEKTATVRIRQLPALAAKDRLTDTRTGITYEIDSIYPDWQANETVCTVARRGVNGG